MEIFLLFNLVFASIAAAQSITSLKNQIPSCAEPAFHSAFELAVCSPANYICQCTAEHQSEIIESASTAIKDACGATKEAQAISLFNKICSIISKRASLTATPVPTYSIPSTSVPQAIPSTTTTSSFITPTPEAVTSIPAVGPPSIYMATSTAAGAVAPTGRIGAAGAGAVAFAVGALVL